MAEKNDKSEYSMLAKKLSETDDMTEKVKIFQQMMKVAPIVIRGGLWKSDIAPLTAEMATKGYKLKEFKLEIDQYHYQATFEKVEKN